MCFWVLPGAVPSQWLLWEPHLYNREQGARTSAAFVFVIPLLLTLNGGRNWTRVSFLNKFDTPGPQGQRITSDDLTQARSQQLTVDCFKEWRYYQPASFLKRKHLLRRFNSLQLSDLKVLNKVCYKKAEWETSGR